MYAIHKGKCIVQHIISIKVHAHFTIEMVEERKEFIAINTWYQYILSAHKENC